jgi:peptide deformylase
MSNLLPIILSPNPILKKISSKVEKIDADIQKLMDKMLATMYHQNGIGLSAVQVGILKRIIVIDINYTIKQNCHDDGCSKSHISNAKPLFLINPEIITKSKEVMICEEGCLSFPLVYSKVTRAKKISVKFLDYYGKEQLMEAEELLADCLQHEIDHLNGIIFIDYISKLKQDILLKKMKKIKRDE